MYRHHHSSIAGVTSTAKGRSRYYLGVPSPILYMVSAPYPASTSCLRWGLKPHHRSPYTKLKYTIAYKYIIKNVISRGPVPPMRPSSYRTLYYNKQSHKATHGGGDRWPSLPKGLAPFVFPATANPFGTPCFAKSTLNIIVYFEYSSILL